MPASCSFKACISKKELFGRNNTEFTCHHIEEIKASEGIEPEEELLQEDCRSILSYFQGHLCLFLDKGGLLIGGGGGTVGQPIVPFNYRHTTPLVLLALYAFLPA